jgi:phosphate uptake regulator
MQRANGSPHPVAVVPGQRVLRRAIERIADNTVDIAEQTAFVVTGLFREFTDASQPA